MPTDMTSSLDMWQLFAGIGLFLLGMTILEESIKTASGNTFRRIIRHSTDGIFKSVGSGAFVTAVIQSSSAVSLMVLAFAGAGMMTMENGIGIIIGSNLGTTFTSWIVALLGFKLDIERLVMPVLALGGAGVVLLNSFPAIARASRMLAGFGILFLGLGYMKESVDVVARNFDFASLPMHGHLFYLAVGIALTAIMQSSSASIAIFLTALNSHIITFDDSVILVIGANIGTTVTALLGCIGGTRIKFRIGLSHLVFNLVTGIIAFAGANIFIAIIETFIDVTRNSVMALAFFHTLFNLTGIILFLPFIPSLADFLKKVVPDRKKCRAIYICHTPAEISDAATIALKKEILHLSAECQLYGARIFHIDYKKLADNKLPLPGEWRKKVPPDQLYEEIKVLHGEIFAFYAMLQGQRLEEEETRQLERFIYASRNIMNAIKDIKGIRHDIEMFAISGNDLVSRHYKGFKARLLLLYKGTGHVLQSANMEQQRLKLLELFTEIEEMDGNFLESVMKASAEQGLDEMEISSLLLVNRLFTQSCRLHVFGLKDLLLSPEEAMLFDSTMERRAMARHPGNDNHKNIVVAHDHAC
jgi:phosphate:Na+ symporter